ncbi:50S ribosomal protein L9 [Sphingomonas sp. PB4P5]|uniref:50S ribosomal protein L9 n=1 Tax=Parasphingomonas puruogangriensis TaxID=3096155 RepID=UPI002FCBDC33
MQVILLERVEKLGAIGDVVTVKDGFARNFLLPNKKALRSNEANRKVFEKNKESIVATNAARRGEAEIEAKTIDGITLTLIRQASNTGQLYGSVAVRDLLDLLETEGHKVPKSSIVLNKPIKAIGLYEVKVALHPEVSVTVKVNVARSPEEAEMQASGVNVMEAMFEKDEAGFVEDYDPNAEPGVTAEMSSNDDAAPAARNDDETTEG